MRGIERDRKRVPEHQRHRIEPDAHGWKLLTCHGYILQVFKTRQEAEAFYSWHCPVV